MTNDHFTEYISPALFSAVADRNPKSKSQFYRKRLSYKGDPWSDKCNIITDAQARKEYLKNSNLCFRCFKKDHTQRNMLTKKLTASWFSYHHHQHHHYHHLNHFLWMVFALVFEVYWRLVLCQLFLGLEELLHRLAFHLHALILYSCRFQKLLDIHYPFCVI